jgi:diguanylate cyclase (GGDEF)-like protein
MTGKPQQSDLAHPPGSSRDPRELQVELEQLRALVAEQAREIRRLDALTETDSLTGLANRRSFQKELQRRHAGQIRDQRPFCLMLIDIDAFKAINDRWGHATGDRYLRSIARAVQRNVRAGDIVFRVGGDEMAILLPGANLQQAEHCAQRLLEETVPGLRSAIPEVPLGLSIGVAESVKGGTVESLFEAADQAMYRAKQQGGNRFASELKSRRAR